MVEAAGAAANGVSAKIVSDRSFFILWLVYLESLRKDFRVLNTVYIFVGRAVNTFYHSRPIAVAK